MIIDTLENLNRYDYIPHVGAIMSFLNSNDASSLTEGDISIQGEELYVKVLRYVPQEAEKNDFETHEFHIDLQVLIEGVEIMQNAPKDSLTDKSERTMDGDFQFFSADQYISNIVVRKRHFAVFFPGEPHKPGCLYQDDYNQVLKLVFKIKTE